MNALKELLKVAEKIEKRYEKLATEHKRCNCEQAKCEKEGKHVAGECKNKAGDKKAMYIGAICDECAKTMPKEYMKTSSLISKAQVASAQAGDIENALKKHGLWDLANEVSPLLNAARVPESAAVKINMVVDKTLMPHFAVALDPPNSTSQLALARLLQQKYGAKMQAALKAENLAVAENVNVGWLTF
jgi:hypothetical protein